MWGRLGIALFGMRMDSLLVLGVFVYMVNLGFINFNKENEMRNKQVEVNSTELQKKEQLENFKSLYYFFKSKRDTDIKLFHETRLFRKRDIEELNSKVQDKIRLHKHLTATTQVTIGLENGQVIPFGTWESFSAHDWNCSEVTRYISIEWDFNVLLENQYCEEIPQTHTLRVRMGNGLKPSELIQVIFQGGEDGELEEAQAQMVCKIDFVNAQICAELKNIVSNWYKTIPKVKENQKFVRFLNRNREKIRQMINMFFILAGIILCQGIFGELFLKNEHLVSNKELLYSFYKLSSFSVIVMYFFLICGRFYSNRIIGKTIQRLKMHPIFEFTKGDENKHNEVTGDNNKLVKNLILGIFISVCANLIVLGINELIKLFSNS